MVESSDAGGGGILLRFRFLSGTDVLPKPSRCFMNESRWLTSPITLNEPAGKPGRA